MFNMGFQVGLQLKSKQIIIEELSVHVTPGKPAGFFVDVLRGNSQFH
jgi:hypothetical protein